MVLSGNLFFFLLSKTSKTAHFCSNPRSSISEKNNSPHLAESTVLYHIADVFDGDIHISLQDGPEMSHYIGKTELESNHTKTKNHSKIV